MGCKLFTIFENNCHSKLGLYLALPQVDIEVDELRVFLDEILQCVGLQKVIGLFFQMQCDLSAPFEGVASWVLHHCERRCIRFPNVLLVVIVL